MAFSVKKNVFLQYAVQSMLAVGQIVLNESLLMKIATALYQKYKEDKQNQRITDLEETAKTSPDEVEAIVRAEVEKSRQAGQVVSADLEQAIVERLSVTPILLQRQLAQTTVVAARRGKTLAQMLPSSEKEQIAFYQQLFPIQPLRFATGQTVPHRMPPLILEEVLGIGGVGEVWRARSNAGGQVAIKFCLDETSAQLLKREAKNLHRLQQQLPKHAHLVQLLDIQLEQQPYWLAFEYVAGGTLEGLMQAQDFSWQASIELLLPLVKAMVEVHQVGIIHRDLKPSNILVTESGELKITDFGIGAILAMQSSDATQLAAFSEHYACKEQRRGETAHPSDDVYALAIILGELLTGKTDLALDELKTLSIPEKLKNLLERCLFHSRANRPAHAGELCTLLEEICPFNPNAELVELQHRITQLEKNANEAQRESDRQVILAKLDEIKAKHATLIQEQEQQRKKAAQNRTEAFEEKIHISQTQQNDSVQTALNEVKRLNALLAQSNSEWAGVIVQQEKFEKTAEYEQRVANLRAEFKQQLADLLALEFVIPTSQLEWNFVKYDADAEIAHVEMWAYVLQLESAIITLQLNVPREQAKFYYEHPELILPYLRMRIEEQTEAVCVIEAGFETGEGQHYLTTEANSEWLPIEAVAWENAMKLDTVDAYKAYYAIYSKQKDFSKKRRFSLSVSNPLDWWRVFSWSKNRMKTGRYLFFISRSWDYIPRVVNFIFFPSFIILLLIFPSWLDLLLSSTSGRKYPAVLLLVIPIPLYLIVGLGYGKIHQMLVDKLSE